MEDIVITKWAKQIHEIKIRELKELIDLKQQLVNSVINSDDKQVVTERHKYIIEICKLKDKLNFLNQINEKHN